MISSHLGGRTARCRVLSLLSEAAHRSLRGPVAPAPPHRNFFGGTWSYAKLPCSSHVRSGGLPPPRAEKVPAGRPPPRHPSLAMRRRHVDQIWIVTFDQDDRVDMPAVRRERNG